MRIGALDFQQTKEMPWLEIAISSLSPRSGALDMTIHQQLD